MYCCKSSSTHTGLSAETVTEALYLAVTAVYMLKPLLGGTMFHIQWPRNYDIVLRLLICVVVSFRLISVRCCIGKGFWVGILFCFLIMKFSWRSTEYTFLIDTALLIAGAVRVPYKKILKVGFFTGGLTVLLAVLGSFTNCIPDLAYHQEGAQFRHSFGIIYPTDFAAHVAFLLIIWWVLYGKRYGFLCIIYATGFLAFMYRYCQAECSAIILILFALCVVYVEITQRFTGKKKSLCRLCKRTDTVLMWVMPICAFTIILLSYLYNSNSARMAELNMQLSNRLLLGKQAMECYGITLFGKAFNQAGYGGNTLLSKNIVYNFVDSSYVLILVRYGAVSLLAVIAQYMWLEKKAIQEGCKRLAFAVALVAIHSTIEHHLPEISYNVFLLLPFADFETKTEITQKQCEGRFCLTANITTLAINCIMLLALPRAVTYLKTVVALLRWDEPANNIRFIVAVSVVILAVLLFCKTINRLVAAVQKNICHRHRLERYVFWPLGTALAVLLIGFICSERVMRRESEKYQRLVALDKPVIETIMMSEISSGKVYVDFLPELYVRELDGIEHMVISAEGLALQEEVTLIIAEEGEVHALIEAGYAYGLLESGNAVYTNSDSAKKAMENIGIILTQYYSRPQYVDLKTAALQNGLELTENNTLLLDGLNKSLWRGPGVTEYYGMFQVVYELRLINSSISEGVVATARIFSDGGMVLWNQADIMLEDFDADQEYICTIDTYLSANCPNMDFLLSVSDGVQIEVQKIKYGKIGE